MWCLLNIFASQKSALSRDTTCASKTPKPKLLFWVSTIPTHGLSKILQVSCHRCNKAIKIASKCVWSFSVREIKNCTNLWWQSNKGDRQHNKGCYHKGQYNVTFFCTKRFSIQPKSAWQPLLPSAKGLSFTFMHLLLCKSQSILPYSFLFSLFASIMWWGKI